MSPCELGITIYVVVLTTTIRPRESPRYSAARKYGRTFRRVAGDGLIIKVKKKKKENNSIISTFMY